MNGEPVARAAEAFGFSRPSFYAAQAALDSGGLAALVPARPGPKGAHKMTADVVGFARERLDADPELSSQALVELIAERFGVKVHRRSVERALARAQRAERDSAGRGKRGRLMVEVAPTAMSSAMSSCARGRWPARRTGSGSDWRMLERRGLAAWARALTATKSPVPAADTRTDVIELPTDAGRSSMCSPRSRSRRAG